uniref:Uncharacterized protein n=1 Tax=candidate division WOR-3 bacterium TaxID=2052148 RepID=A0A7C4GHZ4_UNCW3
MKLTDPIIREGPQVSLHHVAFDSFGVMSMCTRIETPELVVTIDPGVSLQSAAFPLPEPRRRELLARYEREVAESCARSQAIVVSHYHLDHFALGRRPELYAGKLLFTRNREDLPHKQRAIAERFFKAIDGLPEEIIPADNRRFRFGKTELGFSAPVWHGRQNAEPGTVIMTDVKRGRERVLVTSDVIGPTETATTDLICASGCRDLVIDGYATYLIGRFATDVELVKSIVNLCRILAQRSVRTLCLDHHAARDYRYPALLKLVYAKARQLKKRFGTAAELAGTTSLVLDGYQNYGPTRWHKWQPLDMDACRAALQAAIAEGTLDPVWLADLDRWVG